MSNEPGVLYLVATPLGNLADISYRAVEVLGAADVIAAEDTRHSRRLLDRYGVGARCTSLHEHNEAARVGELLARLQAGASVALISDAGTPVISDPGYRLVRAARDAGVIVAPIPGASALVAALSAAGLPTDRFAFEGFLPARAGARRRRLRTLARESRTLIFYEASHRVAPAVDDMREIFGPSRRAVVARELTKRFETIHGDTLGELHAWLLADPNRQKGELVVLVDGADEAQTEDEPIEHTLGVLLAELPLKQAVRLAAGISGRNRNELYRLALAMREHHDL